MNYLSNFAETLDYLMKEADLKESQLAEILGMETATISRYLHSEYAPSVESLVSIADYFHCSTDYLLGYAAEYKKITFKSRPEFSVQLTRFLKDNNAKGISNKNLCVTNGFSKSSLYDWKSGKRQPSLANVLKLAEYFDCSIDCILGREIE